MKRHATRDRANPRGAALLLVLWLLVALSLMTMSLAYSRRVEAVVAGRFRDRTPSYYVARGGVEAAVGAIVSRFDVECHHPGLDWWTSEERYKDVPLGPGKFSLLGPMDEKGRPRFGLEDEESRINVNNATDKMLALIPGMDDRTAGEIVTLRKRLNAAAGRKDPSETDAEAEPAAPAGKTGSKKEGPVDRPPLDAPFRDLADLLVVPGITQQKIDGSPEKPGLARFLTTRSNGTINVNSASVEVLVALGVEKSKAERIVRGRGSSDGSFRDLAAFASTAGLSEEKSKPILKRIALRSGNFRATSIGRVPKSPAAIVRAQISVHGGSAHITGWRFLEGPPPEAEGEPGAAGGAER